MLGDGPTPISLRRWGLAGAVLEELLLLRGLAGWILVEHWAASAIALLLDLIWQVLCWIVPPFGRGGKLHQPGPPCIMAWHHHRDILATCSATGAVAVHAVGDAVSPNNVTEYLHSDGDFGEPLCLAWQPNNVRGALVVGTDCGVVLWRRSPEDGWRRAWSMRGDAFACPAATWSPDGRALATAGAHGVVRVWPHSGLVVEQTAPWCVTLRRWFSGPVVSLQWCPDGLLLASGHAGGLSREPFVRLWDTRSWEVAVHVGLGSGPVAGPSLAWCGRERLLAAAAGRLGELRGLGTSGTGGWTPGVDPLCRTLLMPRLHLPGADPGDLEQAVLEVAVCPRTAQRVAVRIAGASHILVFECLCAEGWTRQELALRGLISATAGRGTDSASEDLPRPCAVAFAGGTVHRLQWDARGEGSLLAVYWDFAGRGAEVRTYPMHFLPHKLVQADASVLFD